jgi:hypothetical protein
MPSVMEGNAMDCGRMDVMMDLEGVHGKMDDAAGEWRNGMANGQGTEKCPDGNV